METRIFLDVSTATPSLGKHTETAQLSF